MIKFTSVMVMDDWNIKSFKKYKKRFIEIIKKCKINDIIIMGDMFDIKKGKQ